MKFANPEYFFLLIPALIVYVLYKFGHVGRQAQIRFSNVKLVQAAGARDASFRRLSLGFVRLMATFFLILALARPQTTTGEEKTTEHVVDIMIALDVSGSMATLDFQPDNRLTAAKLEARHFIEARSHDRIGLVIFAGESFTQCPLTVDHKAILTLLDKIQIGMVEDGTAIGIGLANAVNRLKNSQAKSRVIILLTDGINNTGEIDPRTASDLARQYGIKVYTIGVGKDGMSFLPIQDPRFGTRLLRVQTEIDENTLKWISSNTGGAYFRAQDSQTLHEIFKRIDKLEKTEIVVERFVHYEEYYFWFLWPAFILILFEILWGNLIAVKIP